MRRILSLVTVAAVMAATLAFGASPAMAQGGDAVSNPGVGTPPPLSPCQIETLETIQNRLDSANLTSWAVLIGNIITSVPTDPSDLPVLLVNSPELDLAGQAIAAVPEIVAQRIRQDIDLLFVGECGKLTNSQRAWWESLRALFRP